MSDSKPDNYNINAKICRLVEQYPCMYDRSHANYLKKDVVDQAWIKISKEMNDSISSCKERWRNIRTSYARSINVNKIPASANRTKPYYLHEELQFLSRHITPGIPVSRRTLSNSFHTSPRSEKSEVVEVALGEESIDSYAAGMQYDEEKSQDPEERSSSAVSEATSKNTQDIMDPEISQAEVLPLDVDVKPTEMGSSATAVAATASTTSPEVIPELIPPPMVQIEDDNFDVSLEQRRDTINFACAPPKKRLRVANNAYAYAMENYQDIKPLEIIPPQHDYDNIFLQGLLPEMKAMDFRQKIIFKRRIYEVLTEIFDNSSQATSTTTTSSSPQQMAAQHLQQVPQSMNNTSPIAVVNSSDLSMLRRLNNLLQDANSTPVTPRCVNISSTVLSSPNTPSSITVPIAKIGATTRSSANITRLRMVNASVVVPPPLGVKEEPDTN